MIYHLVLIRFECVGLSLIGVNAQNPYSRGTFIDSVIYSAGQNNLCARQTKDIRIANSRSIVQGVEMQDVVLHKVPKASSSKLVNCPWDKLGQKISICLITLDIRP